jgi:predicted ATPase
LFIFKQWLARVLVLRPMPSLISGDSEQETLEPNVQVTNFAAWFTAVVGRTPAAYSKIYECLKLVMPDLSQIQNLPSGPDSKRLSVEFSNEVGTLKVSFEDLSDGEKCFMIWAVVIAANDSYGPLLCFWDEPDNYLAPWEVGHFVMTLRKAFQSAGQFIATSHNVEAIDRFSRENTLFLHRRNHLEPTLVRPLSEIAVHGDLADALIRGDVEPS